MESAGEGVAVCPYIVVVPSSKAPQYPAIVSRQRPLATEFIFNMLVLIFAIAVNP